MSKKLINRATVFILILFCLTPTFWFWNKGSALIDGVDTNFPLNPSIWLMRRFFAWNDIANGGASNSSNIAGVFFHLVQALPYWLGLNLQLVELASLVFWFSVIIFATFIFAKLIIPKSRLGQVLVVSLYAFNIYLFNTWENVKVSNISLIVGIPIFLSILLAYEKNIINLKKLIFYTAIGSILSSGSGINPAYFLTILLAIMIWAIVTALGLKSKKRLVEYGKGVGLLVGLFFLINLFWIIPTIQYLLFSEQALINIGSIGFNNWVNSLSENTSLLNILRIQGAWDWYSVDGQTNAPLYIPYSINYFFKLPFIVFSFLIPSLAISSFLFSRRKDGQLYAIFGLFMLVGLFLGAGTHPPTGYFFEFLAIHLPFFSFFRSPWYIFTPLLTLAIAGLVGLLIANLIDLFSSSKKTYYRLSILSGLVLLLGVIIYAYPLVTGRIFRPGRSDGFYIQFPSYVSQAEVWLANRYKIDKSRIITYPGDSIEQFNFGYRGPETILELFSSYEVLFNPLNNTDAPLVKLIEDYYRDIDRGALEASRNIADKLNVGLLFDKEDQSSLAPPLPEQILSLPKTDFGNWHFYQLSQTNNKIYSPQDLVSVENMDMDTQINSVLNKNDLIVDQRDNVIKQIPNLENFLGYAIVSQNSQVNDLTNFEKTPYQFAAGLSLKDLSKVNYNFKVQVEGSYQPILERYKVENFGLDSSQQVDGELDGVSFSLIPEKVTDSYVYFQPINLISGNHQLTLHLQNPNLVIGGGDMSQYVAHGQGDFQLTSSDQGKYLAITNFSNKDISAVYKVGDFDTRIPYLIQSRYKQIYGNYAQVEAYQFNSKVQFKSQVQSLPNYPDWKWFSFYYQPVNSISVLEVFVNAPFTRDPLGTTVDYSDLSVRKVFTNNLFFVDHYQVQPLSAVQVNFQQNSSVSYSGQVQGGEGPHILTFAENYSPDWSLAIYDQKGNNLYPHPIHFRANSYTNAWYISDMPNNYKFKIYFKPQSWLNLGFVISGIALATCLGLGSWNYWKKKI